MGYGFYSFYAFGNVIGFQDTNLKTFALFGLGLGCLRELTGKSLIELVFRK